MSQNLQSTITWIRAADQLPDDDITVLIVDGEENLEMGFFDGQTWRYTSSDIVFCGVIFWSEIPQFPTA